MQSNWKYLKRWFIMLGTLLLAAALTGMVISSRAQPAQAGILSTRTSRPTRTPTRTPRLTRTPTRTPMPTNTPTPTWPPYASPTPGPTSVVNGTWKIVFSPNVGTGTYGNQLNAVAMVSASDIWAVGFSPDPSGQPMYIRRSLIEHWDGSSWSVITSPNVDGKPDVRLNGVAAASARDIWAVGHSGDPSAVPYQTLTMHWDGTSWSIIPSPSPGTYNGNDLTAVVAIASNDAWAVGWYQSGPNGQEGGSLTMHWDGASWTVIPNHSKWTLYAITALASNDVWAAGYQVILHWDGASWSSIPFPMPQGGGNTSYTLRGVSATSAHDIWAVGYREWPYNEGYLDSPVTYHWDGTLWSLVPNAGTTYEYLWAVTSIAPNDIWAVGDNGQTQHWNGTAWSRVNAPYPDLGGRFYGVAATFASDIWAVGEYSQNVTYQLRTWIDRYTVP